MKLTWNSIDGSKINGFRQYIRNTLWLTRLIQHSIHASSSHSAPSSSNSECHVEFISLSRAFPISYCRVRTSSSVIHTTPFNTVSHSAIPHIPGLQLQKANTGCAQTAGKQNIGRVLLTWYDMVIFYAAAVAFSSRRCMRRKSHLQTDNKAQIRVQSPYDVMFRLLEVLCWPIWIAVRLRAPDHQPTHNCEVHVLIRRKTLMDECEWAVLVLFHPSIPGRFITS